MGALVAAVVDALAAGGVDVRMGRAVEHIQRRDGGFDVDGSPAAAVVLAAPARAAAPLVRGVCAEASDLLGAVGTASVAIVTVALPADQIDGELPGSGYLVPKPDQGSVTAVSFASNKWAHLRPDDGAHVLRISLGRDGLPVDDWTDDRLVEVAVSETERHLGPRCRTSLVPASVRVSRWPHAFPQYRPGHLERVERLQSILARDAPGLVVAGASHRGIGVPACIHQGRSAAGAIAARVTGVGDSAG
jgi:oxygen-dependent protoporphyrinogen oxidase